MERNYPKIQITDKAARSLRSGHPWVYADEVLQADAACVDGQIVDVTTRSGHWLGAGFYNSASKIRVRVLSRNANDRFDEAFWARRIRYAVDYRRTVIGRGFRQLPPDFRRGGRFSGADGRSLRPDPGRAGALAGHGAAKAAAIRAPAADAARRRCADRRDLRAQRCQAPAERRAWNRGQAL